MASFCLYQVQVVKFAGNHRDKSKSKVKMNKRDPYIYRETDYYGAENVLLKCCSLHAHLLISIILYIDQKYLLSNDLVTKPRQCPIKAVYWTGSLLFFILQVILHHAWDASLFAYGSQISYIFEWKTNHRLGIGKYFHLYD